MADFTWGEENPTLCANFGEFASILSLSKMHFHLRNNNNLSKNNMFFALSMPGIVHFRALIIIIMFIYIALTKISDYHVLYKGQA